MKLGTIIQLPTGEMGTITWHCLDGYGGIWGIHLGIRNLEEVDGNKNIPPPQFMLREKRVEHLLQGNNPNEPVVCVGEDFTVIDDTSGRNG